jgi:hypothetical protein
MLFQQQPNHKISAMKFSMMPSTGSRNVTLGFPNEARQFDLKKDRVCFWGYADVKEISFFISTDVLRHLNPDMAVSEGAILKTFDTARANPKGRIEKVWTQGQRFRCLRSYRKGFRVAPTPALL